MRFPKSPLLIACLFAVGALSGCIAGGDDVEAEQGDEAAVSATSEGTRVTQDSGALKGQVFNVDLEALPGARVTLVETITSDEPKEALVAKDGTYTINDIAPGTYTIFVEAILHASARQSATIVAGAVAEANFLLERIVDPTRPYEIIDEISGKVGWAVAWQAEGPVGCIVQETEVWTVKNCGGLRSADGDDPGDSMNGEVRFDVPERTHTVFAAMVWDPAGPLGEHLQLDLMCPEVPRSGNGAVLDTEHACYFDTPGKTSPLIHRVDKAHWEEAGYNHTGTWAARVFATHGALGTYDAAKVDAGAAYEQAFTIYTQVWVNHAPPADYSPLPDA